MQNYEKLGVFYLGRPHDLSTKKTSPEPLLYDSKDLLTHAMCVGMTGSGKTGLCLSLLEEAAMDGIPALVIDPKGDLGNLLLTFPDLSPADFKPWVNGDEAARKGVDLETFAAQQATLWRDGLARWDQDGERIRRLRQAADFAIYTPGSEAGLPVSILASFAAPPAALRDDADALRDRVSSTATSLLGLLGIDADPIRSREHILIARLLDAAWRAGRDLDLASLIAGIQSPGFDQIGVMKLDDFFPGKDRFALAMGLNNLLAAPGFEAWMKGTPLDVDQLLYDRTGRPRVAIFSLAHLSDVERMFFVSLLLNQTLSWMRGKSGTTSLRALLYMDEIFGFLPPVANPPSKLPFLTLLKQARAFGLGLVLATQNPVDLDYKALSNIGTWLLGRLQTERDKNRVLDGLEGASGGRDFDREKLSNLLSALDKRIFLLHNVHDDGPEVFETRWAMSYLAGPLTRPQIKMLMDPARGATQGGGATSTAATPSAQVAGTGTAAAATQPSTGAGARPLLPPEVVQVFLPPRQRGAQLAYRPKLVGLAAVHYEGAAQAEEVALLGTVADGPVAFDWTSADVVDVRADDLEREPRPGATFASAPAAAGVARNYPLWQKDLVDTLVRTSQRQVFKSRTLGEVSTPGESERDFRIRISDALRVERDQRVDALRRKYAPKLQTLGDQLQRAAQRVEKEKAEASSKKLDAMMTVGSTIFGALFGRRRMSTTINQATTAARRFGTSSKESADVDRAEDSVETLQQRLTALNGEIEAAVAELTASLDPAGETLERLSLRPKKADVEVRLVALAWDPV
jgi:hypothetical protein